MAAAAVRAGRGSVPPHKLVTIRFSHYNERARWALDHHRVPYVESPWLPLLSMFGVLANGGWRTGLQDTVSTALSTPLLITHTGERIHDSGAIMRYADAHYSTPATSLYPKEHADAIMKLEKHYHDFFGPHTRRVAYWYLLDDEEQFLDSCEKNVSARQYRIFRAVWPYAKEYLRKGLGITQERKNKSMAYLQKEFDAVAERLEGHDGDFILGHQFTGADITFASLSAPVLMVQPWEGFGGYLPPVEHLDDDFRDVVKRFRAHPAGQYVMRMFRLHRGERQIPGQPRIADEPPHHVLGSPDEHGGSGNIGTGVAYRVPNSEEP